MPKKKKGGAHKVAVVPKTAEEIRQQQLDARKELWTRMDKEHNNTTLNKYKIQNQWRKIMRLAKTESLKKDIEILSQNHERDVDRKDAILQMLQRDLEESEDQFELAMKSHMSNMDALIRLHDNRMYALERHFQQEVQVLREDWDEESKEVLAKLHHEKAELQSIVNAIEHEEKSRETDAAYAYEQLREEIRNRALEDINMLRISLDAQIEELENHFESAHLHYLQQTAQKTHDFKELTQTDQKLSKDIEHMRKKVDSLQTNIQHWRAKSRTLGRDTEERNHSLLSEKHTIQKHYQQLKQRIKNYRHTQTQRLLHLSQNANVCNNRLNEKLAVARNVLSIAKLARTMETVEERVKPFRVAQDKKENKKKETTDNIDEYNEEEFEGAASHVSTKIAPSETQHLLNPLQVNDTAPFVVCLVILSHL